MGAVSRRPGLLEMQGHRENQRAKEKIMKTKQLTLRRAQLAVILYLNSTLEDIAQILRLRSKEEARKLVYKGRRYLMDELKSKIP